MQEKLIIYIHSHDLVHPSWAVIDKTQTVRQSAIYDHSEGLAQIAEEKQVVVIIPAQDVLLTSANVPKMNRSRLMQALPYALEEQLIDEVDKLHFAFESHEENGELPVAIVSREKMQSWIDLLKTWDIEADIIIPASLAIPFDTGSWTVVLTEIAIVRTSRNQGFACDQHNLQAFLKLALDSAHVKPERIHIQNYTNQPCALDFGIETKEDFAPPEKFIFDCATQLKTQKTISLLQGLFAMRKSKRPQRIKIWKAISYLAAAWIGVLICYPLGSYFILKKQSGEIDKQMVQIYKRNFPQATSVIAPKIRLEEKLKKMNGAAGDNRLLALLGYVGKAMSEVENIKIKRLDFQNNQLTLDVTSVSSENFSAFTHFLQQQGLDVKQQNANLEGSGINATLLIG